MERGWIGSQLLGQGDAQESQGGERMDWLTDAVAGGCQCDPGWKEDGLAHSCWGRGIPRRIRVEKGWIGSQLLGQGDAQETQGGERMD